MQIICNAAAPGGDVPVTADTLGDQASSVRNWAFLSFWVQLPLTIVSAGILFFAISFSRAVSDGHSRTFHSWGRGRLSNLLI